MKGYAITTAKLCWTLVCEHFLVLRVNMAFWGFSHGQIISHHGYGYYHAFEVQFAEYTAMLERETFEYSREKIENQSSTFNLSFDWNVFMEFIACPKSYVT